MENKILKFKTNLNCGSCIASVKPHLEALEGLINWEVDTANADKILSIETDKLSEEEIIETVKNAGYNIERL
ncbi:MAG: heavy-metal-associated domain-containing protein [Bacteroidales bacterium]|jgi:copper chaperone CopZ|nr:heavy-metal-associated domain-containing protein [Bacteroidales bacterium]